MKLKCALIDDEPLALDLLESYVRKTPFLSLEGRYSSAVQALDKLLEAPVDLLFLDIQMPGLDGMEFSKMIKDRCRIVFTTAFSQYALDGYKAEALDYLLKPISYGDFLEASEKALKKRGGDASAGTVHQSPQVIHRQKRQDRTCGQGKDSIRKQIHSCRRQLQGRLHEFHTGKMRSLR